MGEGRLVLIKHAMPVIEPGTDACLWRLSARGVGQCAALATALGGLDLARLVSSEEPKAVSTAEETGRLLGVPVSKASGLGEHDRRGGAFFESPEDFEAAVLSCLRRPGEVVYGRESADAAHARFSAGIEGVLARHGGAPLGVVAHGTVISLFAGRLVGESPEALWHFLGLPSFVVLEPSEGGWVIASRWSI